MTDCKYPQIEIINKWINVEKIHNSHASGSGSSQFIQLCHQRFYQDTSSRWQTRTHRPVCVCRPQACVFSEAKDVLLNERRRVEAWLCWCLIHRVSLGGLTHTNRPIQFQRTCSTDVIITDRQEITGLLLCHLLSFIIRGSCEPIARMNGPFVKYCMLRVCCWFNGSDHVLLTTRKRCCFLCENISNTFVLTWEKKTEWVKRYECRLREFEE